MAIGLTAVTGATVTGLTTPTYTPTADTAPDVNGKQYAITALGGTQTGVGVHSIASPFTVTFWRAKILRMAGRVNAQGFLVANPVNVHKVVTRKGMIPLAGQRAEMGSLTTAISVPAGAETNDPNSLAAAISCHIGALQQQADNLRLLATNGNL